MELVLWVLFCIVLNPPLLLDRSPQIQAASIYHPKWKCYCLFGSPRCIRKSFERCIAVRAWCTRRTSEYCRSATDLAPVEVGRQSHFLSNKNVLFGSKI